MDLDFALNERVKNMVEINVFQQEGVFSRNKKISMIQVRIDECFSFPGKWAINNAFYLLHDPEVLAKVNLTEVGRIYLQAKFTSHNQIDDNREPHLTQYF